jgi:hypothetical protein
VALAQARGEPASFLPLTDRERMLRDRAWHFLMPARPRTDFDLALAELGRTRVIPPTELGREAYLAGLYAGGWTSQTALYRRLANDAADDTDLIPAFRAIAAAVLETDRLRERGFAYVATLGPEERADALARIAENQALIGWVEAAARARLESYRYALQHLFIAVPARDGIAAERALTQLETVIAAGGPISRVGPAPGPS